MKTFRIFTFAAAIAITTLHFGAAIFVSKNSNASAKAPEVTMPAASAPLETFVVVAAK